MKTMTSPFAKMSRVLGCAVFLAGAGNGASHAQQPSTLTETYDDWIVQCRQIDDAGAAKQVCQMSQELRQKDNGKRVLVFAIGDLKGDKVKADLVAPFGLNLSEGLSIEIDGAQIAHASFRTCIPIGCLATIELNDDAMSRLFAGVTLQIGATTDDSKSFAMQMSLKGFSAAYNRLQGLAG